MIISQADKQSIQPVVASSTAAAGLEPVLPVSKTGVLTCYTKLQETTVRFELTLTELQSAALPSWLHCLKRPRKDSNLHDAGLEDPCLHPFGDEDKYL